MSRLALLAILLLMPLACEAQEEANERPEPRHAVIEIGIHRVDADVADTPTRRQRGLSGRPSLTAGRGMLFPYDPPGRPVFWMPDMHFDIDIVWIRAGRILGVTANIPHQVSPPLPRYSPPGPIDLVLEVPAGSAERNGWRVGDAVRVDPTPRYRPGATD
ncbi:MAG: DUF192 domain-containing protein [Deltaproteobacteria bacterium]|nr:DUF192 domain-containing protein [Deltaproteobacteria bacterium]MBW2395089.1 DUF192 domain-containing protein [Deltaproteobacteria bacterium]